jgi:hypothetical protein
MRTAVPYRVRPGLASAAGLLCLSIVACGGRLAAEDIDGRADGGSRAGSADAARSPADDPDAMRKDAGPGTGPLPGLGFFVCPPTIPALGEPCDPVGLVCTYDNTAFTSCPSFECGANGGWQPGPPGC